MIPEPYKLTTLNDDFCGGDAHVMASGNKHGLEHNSASFATPQWNSCYAGTGHTECSEASAAVGGLTVWEKPVPCLNDASRNKPILRLEEWDSKVVSVQITAGEDLYSGPKAGVSDAYKCMKPHYLVHLSSDHLRCMSHTCTVYCICNSNAYHMSLNIVTTQAYQTGATFNTAMHYHQCL